MEYTLPIKLESTANLREHWASKYRRMKKQKQATIIIKKHPLPCVVEIVRIGKRTLDGDNLQNAAKAVRDGIAARLGVDDADPRVEWRYSQQKGEPSVIVRISNVPQT